MSHTFMHKSCKLPLNTIHQKVLRINEDGVLIFIELDSIMRTHSTNKGSNFGSAFVDQFESTNCVKVTRISSEYNE